MDFSFNAQQKNMEQQCKKFAEDHLFNSIDQLENDLTQRLALFQKMGREGLFSLVLPTKGGKTDTISYVLGIKEIAKTDAGIAVAMAVTNMVAETINRYGTETQRSHYLNGIDKGKGVPLSFALTEKQAGSDVKAIEAAFKKEADHSIVLNGTKQFITNGDLSETLVVFAKDQLNQIEGLTALLVDQKTKGFNIIKKEKKLGLLTVNLVSVHFDSCILTEEAILGSPGKGISIALSALDSGRIGIAAQSIGIAEAAYEAALNFSASRFQFGHAIGENQAIAFKLADMQVKLEAAKSLVYKAAWLKDEKMAFSKEASIAKLYCSEICNEIATDALQIHGGRGYIKEYLLEKYFRDARATTLYEGTSEIQRLIISRHL